MILRLWFVILVLTGPFLHKKPSMHSCTNQFHGTSILFFIFICPSRPHLELHVLVELDAADTNQWLTLHVHGGQLDSDDDELTCL